MSEKLKKEIENEETRELNTELDVEEMEQATGGVAENPEKPKRDRSKDTLLPEI